MPEPTEELEVLQRRVRDLEMELEELRAGPEALSAGALMGSATSSGNGSQGAPASAPCVADARMTQLLLDKAMGMASVGVWSVEMATGELSWSDEVFRIHELPVGDPPSVDEAITFYAPEARATVESALDRLLSTGEAYDLELPLVTAKNNRIWVRGIGDIERDADGNPKRLYGVFQEITSQVTLAQERERAREQAESATRATSEFLATMSHEIRTPLNGILGMAQVLEQSTLDQDQLSYVEAIRASGSALLVLLNDILDLSKIESGRLTINRVAFDLEGLVRESVDLLSIQLCTDAVDLRLVIDPAIAGSWIGDPVRVRQVFLNLLGNALKFTDDGFVEVRVREAADGGIRIEVEDTGVGIEPEDEKHLFEAFQQADSSTTRRFGGSGLGLAICQRLVDHMGGKIGVQSTPGAGSEFWFELAIERASLRSTTRVDATEQEVASGAPRAVVATPTRVLVVEDNPVNQIVARKLVESLGNEVTLACNGDEGVDAAFAAEFDIVLMDCQMPVLDGYEATRRLRRLEKEAGRPHIPVIAMTANAMDGDRERCLAAGMDDYLPKPVDRAQLAAIIGRWVTRGPRPAA